MHFLRIQMAVADQFTGKQQHGDLVAMAHAGGGIRIHVDHVDAVSRDTGQLAERSQQLVAQTAALARVQQEARRGGGAQWAVDGLTPPDLTECAMNSTVCAGTSPTAVT